jgi:hypothetical protein
MTFTKTEMQEELFNFMSQFGRDIARLYGDLEHAWTAREAIYESPLWKAASDMYDYGVTGTPSGDLYPGGHIYGVYGNLERFLRGIDTPNMRLFLEESDNSPPHLTMLAAQTAVARMVLDDGWRHTDYGSLDNGVLKGDMSHLTLAEVALLANMDERSVRNAANPKLTNPLKTEQVGQRSLVRPDEARRWLAGRKGYVPTQAYDGPRIPSFDLTLPELPKEFLEQVQREAEETGISAQKILAEQIQANLQAAFKAYEAYKSTKEMKEK